MRSLSRGHPCRRICRFPFWTGPSYEAILRSWEFFKRVGWAFGGAVPNRNCVFSIPLPCHRVFFHQSPFCSWRDLRCGRRALAIPSPEHCKGGIRPTLSTPRTKCRFPPPPPPPPTAFIIVHEGGVSSNTNPVALAMVAVMYYLFFHVRGDVSQRGLFTTSKFLMPSSAAVSMLAGLRFAASN